LSIVVVVHTVALSGEGRPNVPVPVGVHDLQVAFFDGDDDDGELSPPPEHAANAAAPSTDHTTSAARRKLRRKVERGAGVSEKDGITYTPRRPSYENRRCDDKLREPTAFSWF
jgi:hypothetical protein